MTDLITSPCQCEHVSHFDRTKLSPNGNPSHKYGQQFVDSHIVETTTLAGKFYVCKSCADDCYHPDNLARFK